MKFCACRTKMKVYRLNISENKAYKSCFSCPLSHIFHKSTNAVRFHYIPSSTIFGLNPACPQCLHSVVLSGRVIRAKNKLALKSRFCNDGTDFNYSVFFFRLVGKYFLQYIFTRHSLFILRTLI